MNLERAPVEPDLVPPWTRNVWLYGLRTPFSLVFLGWITVSQVLSFTFRLDIYLYTVLASFLGLIVGAHYIEIATSGQKFSPFFRIPVKRMLAIGVISVLLGGAVGVYIAVTWNQLFLAFVVVETAAAMAYPREKPKVAHSYLSFGLAWGTIPFLASYFVQSGSLNLLILGVSVFVGVSVVMMHHLAIMSRESPAWKDALYLLRLYRYSVYSIGVLAIIWRIFSVTV